jgi:integrase
VTVTRQVRARVLLDEARALGVSLADLIAVSSDTAPRVPTVAEFVDTITPTFTPGTAGTYRAYWRLLTHQHGGLPLDEITICDLQAVVETAVRQTRQRRPDSLARSTRETCVGALRALFGRAVAAGHIATNPALGLTKPRRARSRRRALTDGEVTELIAAVRATSHDPDLDLLLVRFHLESGARRQGALNLRLGDIDPRRATVWLREKGSEREQPISPGLIALLQRHATTRSAIHPDDPVLRSRHGTPLSKRRYNTLFDRARPCLAWAARTPVSAHVLRHTAITAVARLAGYPVAQTFAGHNPPTVTGTYLHATITEVATTIATLTGEPHPLANPTDEQTRCTARRKTGIPARGQHGPLDDEPPPAPAITGGRDEDP